MTNDQLNIAELPELPIPSWMINGGHLAWSVDEIRSYGQTCALAAQAPLVERIKELERELAAFKGVEQPCPSCDGKRGSYVGNGTYRYCATCKGDGYIKRGK